MAERQDRCELCRWWEPKTEDIVDQDGLPDIGLCRRNAPVPSDRYKDKKGRPLWPHWPITERYDWCGEFER